MRNKKIYFILSAALLFILTFVFAPVNKVAAATFFLSPSSGNFKVGSNFSVSLYVNSDGKAMNGATAQINFPKEKLSVVSVASGGSIINFWAEAPSYSNSAGTINLSGVALNPGFNGRSGKIITITFKAKEAGKISLSLSSTQILANDGLGTNIFNGASGAQFSLIEEKAETLVVPIIASKPTAIIKKEPECAVDLTAPLISSETHPQTETWYNNNDPIFSWELPTGTQSIGLVIDNNPDTVPEFIAKSLLTKYQANNVMDGVWYLHAQFLLSKEWTKIAHFRFNIDATPPELTDVSIAEMGSVKKMLKIAALDHTSGVAKYTVKINDGAAITLDLGTNTYSLDYLKPGAYQVEIGACDLAGNCSTVIKKFNVSSDPINLNQEIIDELKATQRQLYWSLAALSLFIILVIIYFLSKIRKKPRRRK